MFNYHLSLPEGNYQDASFSMKGMILWVWLIPSQHAQIITLLRHQHRDRWAKSYLEKYLRKKRKKRTPGPWKSLATMFVNRLVVTSFTISLQGFIIIPKRLTCCFDGGVPTCRGTRRQFLKNSMAYNLYMKVALTTYKSWEPILQVLLVRGTP